MQLVSSAIDSSGGTISYVLKQFGVGTNGLISQTFQRTIGPAGSTLLAAPVVFSGDGLNVYAAIPGEMVSAPEQCREGLQAMTHAHLGGILHKGSEIRAKQ